MLYKLFKAVKQLYIFRATYVYIVSVSLVQYLTYTVVIVILCKCQIVVNYYKQTAEKFVWYFGKDIIFCIMITSLTTMVIRAWNDFKKFLSYIYIHNKN